MLNRNHVLSVVVLLVLGFLFFKLSPVWRTRARAVEHLKRVAVDLDWRCSTFEDADVVSNFTSVDAYSFIGRCENFGDGNIYIVYDDNKCEIAGT